MFDRQWNNTEICGWNLTANVWSCYQEPVQPTCSEMSLWFCHSGDSQRLTESMFLGMYRTPIVTWPGQEKTWLNYVTILKRFKRPLGGHLTGKLTLKLFKCYIILFSGNLTTPAPDNDNWTVHLISNNNFTIIRIPPPPPLALHYVSPTSIATVRDHVL